MKKFFSFTCEMSEEQLRYLETAARIRATSVTRIVQRVVETVAREQMVLAVLDDDSRPSRDPHERAFHYRRTPRATPSVGPSPQPTTDVQGSPVQDVGASSAVHDPLRGVLSRG